MSKSSSLSSLLSLLILSTTINAIPHPSPDPHTEIVQNNYKGTVIEFAQQWPTCSNDKTFLYTKGEDRTTATVNTQPDCDQVIDNICKAVVRAQAPGRTVDSIKAYDSISSTVNSCQGFIMFSQLDDMQGLTYDGCASMGTSVSQTCLLMGGKSSNNYASEGRQAGVQNVHWTSTSAPYWFYDYRDNEPGFLLGPPEYFGSLNSIDADKV
ncbi:hypothetical protein ACLMJK_003600 [Lecanora helva]